MSTERVDGQFGYSGIHASRLTHSSSSISQTFPPVPGDASRGIDTNDSQVHVEAHSEWDVGIPKILAKYGREEKMRKHAIGWRRLMETKISDTFPNAENVLNM
ncbi:uncharacterized protein IAS62_006235 [Cryptococcus decagattii]|uniref:Uncharacterized protein n=1 Tax=Cryptococcus decagattii TaxID=1859122 RepID=A0ABZ2B5Y5_9TREE